MLPTLSDYKQGAASWVGTHKGVRFKVSHHGVSDYNREGTWCFYVYFDERMFQRPEDWARFDLKPVVKESRPGSFWEHFPYDSLPELSWHGGPTWGGRHSHLDRKTGRRYTVIEAGCDYGHLFDRERGYPYTLESVRRDAAALVEEFVARFPQNEACAYCGLVAPPDEFYTAKNGARVHKSQRVNLPAEWDQWIPVGEVA